MGGRGSKFKGNLNIKNVDKIDIKNKDVVNSYCKQTLDYLADFKGYEENVLITRTGKVYHILGDKYSIEVPKNLSTKAKIDIHNHPHDANRSFSKEDRASWKVGCEYLLTDGIYNYRAIVKKQIKYDANLYQNALTTAAQNGIFNDDSQHLECLYLQSKGYIDYERMERHT